MLELDELDLMLVKELEVDARQSDLELASKLGTSNTTVRRRIQRLLNTRAIDITVVVDPASLGLNTRVFIGIGVQPGASDETEKALRSHKRVQAIVSTTGRYDMLIYAVFHNTREQFTFVDKVLGDIPGIVKAEEMAVVKLKKSSWRRSRGDISEKQMAVHRGFSETEQALIRELRLCPRESITNLGKKIGLSRVSVAKKLQALLDGNIVSVACLANPQALGFFIQAAILVRARLGKIDVVADAVANDPKISHVAIVSGRFNIFLWAHFRDWEEMSSFIKRDLDRIPDIVDHETMFRVGIPKNLDEQIENDYFLIS